MATQIPMMILTFEIRYIFFVLFNEVKLGLESPLYHLTSGPTASSDFRITANGYAVVVAEKEQVRTGETVTQSDEQPSSTLLEIVIKRKPAYHLLHDLWQNHELEVKPFLYMFDFNPRIMSKISSQFKDTLCK